LCSVASEGGGKGGAVNLWPDRLTLLIGAVAQICTTRWMIQRDMQISAQSSYGRYWFQRLVKTGTPAERPPSWFTLKLPNCQKRPQNALRRTTRGPAGNPLYRPLRAPWARILGTATKSMLGHLQGAVTTKPRPCRRNPLGWRGLLSDLPPTPCHCTAHPCPSVVRPISSSFVVADGRASTSSSLLDLGSQDPPAGGTGVSGRASSGASQPILRLSVAIPVAPLI
jgi:hypothetical protein